LGGGCWGRPFGGWILGWLPDGRMLEDSAFFFASLWPRALLLCGRPSV